MHVHTCTKKFALFFVESPITKLWLGLDYSSYLWHLMSYVTQCIMKLHKWRCIVSFSDLLNLKKDFFLNKSRNNLKVIKLKYTCFLSKCVIIIIIKTFFTPRQILSHKLPEMWQLLAWSFHQVMPFNLQNDERKRLE